MNASERYRKLTREFYADTGLVAPGEIVQGETQESVQMRLDAWYEWLDNRSEAQND